MKHRNFFPQNQNFPQQTHFLGVLVPDDITETLESCRRYMNQKYGCKSGYGTPIHITLVPPFRLDEAYTTKDIVAAVQKLVSSAEFSGFTAHIDNFDAFGDRTVFAKVSASKQWTDLRDKVFSAVSGAVTGSLRKDTRPFQPHLTVANRDIPAGASTEALQAFNELNLVEEFQIDNITVFERNGGRWNAAATLEF